MVEPNAYTRDLQLLRSLLIVTSLQRREDVTARQAVERFPVQLSWGPLEELLIDREVWDSTRERSDPRFIFCHPDLLIAAPIASLYYRGLCGLSLKAVAGYVGEVAKIERGSGAARLSRDKAVKINRTYNTFICSIIKNSADWTLDNGYRTIIATLGITLDGVMRNRIGDVAEQRVRSMVLEFLFENDLIVQPRLTREEILDDIPGQCELPERVLLKFGSEPDISFSRVTEAGSELLAIVEIKGGTDPAGALERYGAAIKSFQDALSKNIRCKNFFLSAVYTPELERRIREDRLVEKYFNLVEILENRDERKRFFRELFHFTLRLI